MYEIWLTLNIFYELALSVWPALAGIAAVWLLLLWRARGGAWRPCLKKARIPGLAVTLIAFFLLPTLNDSALGEMRYWVDWLTLVGLALACGAAATLFFWPLMVNLRKWRRGA